MIDILLFLLIGLAGVIITLIIYRTGKKEEVTLWGETGFWNIELLKIGVCLFLIVYLFRFIMMFFTGVFTGLYVPAVVGGLFALIPTLLFVMVNRKKVVKSRV